jgi:uncharacterized protein YndB with AHSA1/START domain
VRRIGTSILIDAPSTTVWRLLGRFEHWPEWGTTVRAVVSDADEVAVGVEGKVKTIAGPWLPFVITDVEHGRTWDWKVAGRRATGHALEPIDASRTRVTFTVAWPLAPYVIAMRAALRNLKRLAETP